MEWAKRLVEVHSAAQAAFVISVVVAVGMAIGAVRVRGVGLGMAGVLFAGLAGGRLLGLGGVTLDEGVMEALRELGLILFVYAIGVQVGPGFFDSLRREGLRLNALAAIVVVSGVLCAAAVHRWGGVELPVVAGLLSGATTNTPSLAAAQQALQDAAPAGHVPGGLTGVGYAVAYPFGILGIILTMVLARIAFGVNVATEAAAAEQQARGATPPLRSVNLEVRNPGLEGVPLGRVPTLRDSGVVVSRLSHDGKPTVAGPETLLHVGDLLHAVGPPEQLEELRLIAGVESVVDVRAMPGDIVSRQAVVTDRGAVGRPLAELDLRGRLGVNVTRVHRAGLELPPRPGLRVQFADRITIVGSASAVERAAAEMGNSTKELEHPQLLPVFIGIAIGVVLGIWPIHLPGIATPVKLGLAGGPLLAAIVLSRLGNIGRLVWYLPPAANAMLRELGIAVFLAAVGLRSGGPFFEAISSGGDGLRWMAFGAAITLVPLLVVAAVGRLVLKLNYPSLCGLLSGSMTDPPALAFGRTIAGSDAPLLAYASVYPLTMFLRVLGAQLLVLLLR